MKKGEVAELVVQPQAASARAIRPRNSAHSRRKTTDAALSLSAQMAFGDEGDAALGVPPSAAVRLHVTLDSWIPSDDISKGKDGTAVKRTLVQTTDSWERPFDKFECHLDYVVRAPGGPGARAAAGRELARGSFTAESPLTVGSYDDAALRGRAAAARSTARSHSR